MKDKRVKGIIVFLLSGYIIKESPFLYMLSKELVQEGFKVIVFNDMYDDEGGEYNNAGMKVIKHSDFKSVLKYSLRAKFMRLFFKILRAAYKRFSFFKISDFEKMYNFKIEKLKIKKLSENCLEKFKKINDDRIFIVVEPEAALVFANMRMGSPHIYLSLELNNLRNEHPSDFCEYKRKVTKKIIETSLFSIIQDENRENLLKKDLEIQDNINFFHFPVSIKGPILKKHTYLKDKFGISEEKTIVLYSGSIMPWALLVEIVESANNWNEKYVLVIHGGRYDVDYLNKIIDIAKSKNIFISTDWVSYEEIEKLIASAHIGIACYIENTINNVIIDNASGKIAYYLKAGLPVVMKDNQYNKKFVEKFQCGQVFDKYCNIGGVLDQIVERYPIYKENAYSTFNNKYDFDVYYQKLIKEIEKKYVETV